MTNVDKSWVVTAMKEPFPTATVPGNSVALPYRLGSFTFSWGGFLTPRYNFTPADRGGRKTKQGKEPSQQNKTNQIQSVTSKRCSNGTPTQMIVVAILFVHGYGRGFGLYSLFLLVAIDAIQTSHTQDSLPNHTNQRMVLIVDVVAQCPGF